MQNERSETVRRESEDPRDKKNKTGKEEEKGAKRSIGEWDEFAKKIKIRAEERAEESKNPGEGVDNNQVHVAKESGAVSVGESDVKFDETAPEFISSV